MTVSTFNFTTGPSTLEDIGELSYNGCKFSPLFATTVSGTAVKDDAGRTVKYMEYLITADGYVTAPTGFLEEAAQDAVVGSINAMRLALTAQGGALVYRGRGCDLVVNPAGGGGTRDAAWGPAPELLEFQPLGGGCSAKVRWQVKVRVVEYPPSGTNRVLTGNGPAFGGGGNPGGGGAGGDGFFNAPGKPAAAAAANNLQRRAAVAAGGGLAAVPLLQFNYESELIYDRDGYSSISVRGVLEIPLTRTPTQATRTMAQTADDMRVLVETRVMSGIDLGRFMVTRRKFGLSRDKRKLEWDFLIEEKPYMDLPLGCTTARGSYNVRPARTGPGLCLWVCSLRATYTVRGPVRWVDGAASRRLAWLNFLNLLRLRMAASKDAPDFPLGAPPANPRRANGGGFVQGVIAGAFGGNPVAATNAIMQAQNRDAADGRKAWLIDFGFDEGLYLDSKTTSFHAAWRLNCVFDHILLASGVWRRLPEANARSGNLWALSINDIMGEQSWLTNRAATDVIVDFGGQ